jgi:hypothetical protein
MKKVVLSCAALGLALGFASGPVQAAVYDFSFADYLPTHELYGSGTLTVSGAASPYAVTSATGTIHDGYLAPGTTDFTITGLTTYAAADNLLYFPAVVPGGPSGPINGYVSFGGISFTTNGASEFNLGGGGTSVGAPFYDVLNESTLNQTGLPIGSGQLQGSYDIALSVTAAPGPNVGEGLLGFAAMSALLIAARCRGLLV